MRDRDDAAREPEGMWVQADGLWAWRGWDWVMGQWTRGES